VSHPQMTSLALLQLNVESNVATSLSSRGFFDTWPEACYNDFINFRTDLHRFRPRTPVSHKLQ